MKCNRQECEPAHDNLGHEYCGTHDREWEECEAWKEGIRIGLEKAIQILKRTGKSFGINQYTHLCIRKMPEDDKEFIGQIKGGQGNLYHAIKKELKSALSGGEKK